MSDQWDDLPEEVQAELNTRMKAAMALPLDHRVFTGAENAPQGLPRVAHGEVLATHGADPEPPTTREEGGNLPEVPHSGEQPTPKDRRDAWLMSHIGLVRQMEDRLAAVRDFLPYASRPSAMVNALAEEWAVLQLLKALRDMKAPEVPEDPLPGQLTIHDAVAGNLAGCRGECGIQHGPYGECL